MQNEWLDPKNMEPDTGFELADGGGAKMLVTGWDEMFSWFCANLADITIGLARVSVSASGG